MEALILALFAFLAIILLEAGYWIAVAFARWAPLLAIGALVGWLAQRNGADHFEALALGALACLVARHLQRTRSWSGSRYEEDF